MKVLETYLRSHFTAEEKVYLNATDAHSRKSILPFVTQSHPALPNLKNIQMGK